MDLGAIGAVITSLNALKDIGKAAASIRDQSRMQEMIIEFQAKIMDAQQAVLVAQQERMELIGKIDELERELAASRDWESVSKHYSLEPLGKGHAYRLNSEHRDVVPDHYICPNCFEDRRKSILHRSNHIRVYEMRYFCASCTLEIFYEAS